jgi:hypothetical protein
MPLDSLKIAHIQSLYSSTKIWSQRQKTVVLVSQSGSTFSYTTLSCIFRPQEVIDIEIPDKAGTKPKMQYDIYMVAPIGTNFTGVTYVADTTTATAAAVSAAPKYEIIEVVPVGLVPGGTRLVVFLRRFR